VRAVEGLEEEVDLIVLAVKTQDVASSLEQHTFHGLACPVVTTQNGVRADTLLAERIDPQRIVSSIVMFGATYLTPGKIVHNFEGDLIKIVEKVFPVIVTEDIMGMKWLKLFVNLNNCVPALIGKSMQECFADIHLCTVSIALLKEGLQLTEQTGINLHSLPTYPVERLHVLTSLPLEESARLFSKIMTNLSKEPLYGSILQSIRRGKPSEIDYLNGELVALAKERGCSAPLNEKMVEMVHQVEESNNFFSPHEVIQELSMTI
jgi:2-dehydropantoate 2-reductase